MRGSRAGASARRLASGAVVLLCAALSGCQSNPEPPPLEGAPTSASPSPSPTEAAPTLPAEANGTSPASAKAFALHYVNTVNYSMRTGDTPALIDIAAPRCSTCAAIIRQIDEVYEAGGRLEGDGWKPISITYFRTGGDTPALVAVGIEISPQVAYTSPSSSPSRSPKSRGNLDLHLDRNASGWFVRRLEATQ